MQAEDSVVVPKSPVQKHCQTIGFGVGRARVGNCEQPHVHHRISRKKMLHTSRSRYLGSSHKWTYLLIHTSVLYSVPKWVYEGSMARQVARQICASVQARAKDARSVRTLMNSPKDGNKYNNNAAGTTMPIEITTAVTRETLQDKCVKQEGPTSSTHLCRHGIRHDRANFHHLILNHRANDTSGNKQKGAKGCKLISARGIRAEYDETLHRV